MTGPHDRAPSNSSSSNGSSDPQPRASSSHATHQRLPNETAAEYQQRRQTLELDAEARRLEIADRRARAARTNLTANRLINGVYFLIGALEILLVLRFILRASGANVENSFAGFIYGLSEPFVAPFSTLFISPTAEGARYIFDLNLLAAMIAYGILGLLAGQLIRVLVGDTSHH
ncbi:MAG: YggT family protein [Leptolyngbya sp. RL_3_1]|nr:YggT family protein [Leptolyngbya sp. RL_3_1]